MGTLVVRGARIFYYRIVRVHLLYRGCILEGNSEGSLGNAVVSQLRVC